MFGVLVGVVAGGIGRVEAEEIQIKAVHGTGSLSITDGACAAASASQTAYDAANNTLDISVLASSIASNCLGIAITTNNSRGYSMTIAGPSSGNLVLANQAFGSMEGSVEAPVVFAGQMTGEWGFAVPSGQVQGVENGFDGSYTVLAPSNTTNTAKYAAVPNKATPISQTTAANLSVDEYDFFFAVATGDYAATGTYAGVITISASGNAAALPGTTGSYMQSITLENCPTERTRVVDARDGNTYWARKISGVGVGGGDLCWMETNLAYAGGGDNTYEDTMVLTQGRSNSPTMPLYDIPTGANPTSGTTDPSTSTNGTGQYGYLYNWCAAMGNQPAACQTSEATQPDQSVNICPAGWRLPTGGVGGEFTLLNNAINGGSTTSASGLLTGSLFMNAGFFDNGAFSFQGGYGAYWSSTVISASNASRLLFGGSNNPNGTGGKGSGSSVRCVNDYVSPVEASAGVDMQRITLNGTSGNYYCPVARTRAVDARDDKTYWVRRIDGTRAGGGDLCWMETNLAYVGGGDDTYGDVIDSMTQGRANTPTVMLYDIPTGANPTFNPDDPSTSTTGTGQYGYLYNWCAAMGGQPDACQISEAIQPDQGVSICPAGWRLPTGEEDTGEFALLNDAINGGSEDSPSGLLANSLYMYAGFFGGGSFTAQGSFGFYWSSTASYVGSAHNFYFHASGVATAGNSTKGAGNSVRCVAP